MTYEVKHSRSEYEAKYNVEIEGKKKKGLRLEWLWMVHENWKFFRRTSRSSSTALVKEPDKSLSKPHLNQLLGIIMVLFSPPSYQYKQQDWLGKWVKALYKELELSKLPTLWKQSRIILIIVPRVSRAYHGISSWSPRGKGTQYGFRTSRQVKEHSGQPKVVRRLHPPTRLSQRVATRKRPLIWRQRQPWWSVSQRATEVLGHTLKS